MKSGFLQVDQQHQIYFETQGNKDGIPVLVLHGGPGGNLNQNDFEFFDPVKYFTILYDQRGTGNSLPKGSLENNSTDHLVNDILKLLDFFGIDEILLFGGSWGSCLALIFTIRHPEKVSGLVLRGLFLGTLEDRAHFEKGGNETQFPDIWNRFKSLVPADQQERLFDFYLEKILAGDPSEQKIYAYELDRYGLSMYKVGMTPEEVAARLENYDGVDKARIFAHYSKHNFFLPANYIKENIFQIPADLKIQLVHGKQDWICLPNSAARLAKLLPNTTLHLEDGGHSQHCSGVKEKLMSIMRDW